MRKLKVLLLLFPLSLGQVAYPQEQITSNINLGGAIRYNYRITNYDNKQYGGNILYDMFRVNLASFYKKIESYVEFRWYSGSSGGGMLKEGWIAYNFNDNNQLKVGQTLVPFGLLPYQSNSYYFNINYYIGLEDDYDIGLSYQYNDEKFQVNAAFFKNSELTNKRYSYDLDYDSKEINTLAGRVSYKGNNTIIGYEIGASGLVGQIYNFDIDETNIRCAAALHCVLNMKNVNLKTQYTIYNYNCRGDITRNYVTMGAFGSSYRVADIGASYSICISYNFKLKNKLVDDITIYNDYSRLSKRNMNFHNSEMNVIGCQVSAGPILVYADYVIAKNHPWIGSDWDTSFAEGADNKWCTCFNLNFGYYF